MPGGAAPKFGSEKVSRYTGVSQLQLRVSRYTVQLRSQTAVSSKGFGPRGTKPTVFSRDSGRHATKLESYCVFEGMLILIAPKL